MSGYKEKKGTNKGSVDITLLFCPLLFTTEPHLAVPHLSAFLKSKGYRVISRDFNIEFLKMFRDKAFLSHSYNLLESKLHRLKFSRITEKNYPDYIKVNIALAAIDSLLEEVELPLNLTYWKTFSLRVFAVQSAFGFDTMVQNDFIEYFDDFMSFQGVKKFPRDWRLVPYRRSSIAETITQKKLSDADNNLFLPVFEFSLLETLRRQKPKIIGLSVSTNEQIIQALSIAQLIKEKMPDVHVTAGGSYFSYLEKEHIRRLMELGVLDSVIRYEGESALVSLVDAIVHKKTLVKVPNLIYKDRDNTIVINTVASPLQIESLPIPDYEHTYSLLEDNRALSVYVSRGCYWGKCSYCTYNAGQTQFSIKPARRLVKELKTLNKKYGVKCFNLISESISPAYARKISEEILKENLQLELSIWARAENGFDRELCVLMKKAGFHLVTLGVESLNDKILRLMRKGLTARDTIDVIRTMAQAGILIQVNIIMGFPGESYQDALHTYRTIENELRDVRLFRLVVGPFAVLRGSLVYRHPAEFGIKIKPEKSAFFRPKSIFAPFEYTKKDNSFNTIITISKLYHKNLAGAQNSRAAPYNNFFPNAGGRYIDYTVKDNSITRSPSYIVIDFDNGIMCQREPIKTN